MGKDKVKIESQFKSVKTHGKLKLLDIYVYIYFPCLSVCLCLISVNKADPIGPKFCVAACTSQGWMELKVKMCKEKNDATFIIFKNAQTCEIKFTKKNDSSL